ncbi:MAG TPA: hypothetical protein VGD66_14860 [Allosphingosinicella sp.]|jgi:hypothetical protein
MTRIFTALARAWLVVAVMLAAAPAAAAPTQSPLLADLLKCEEVREDAARLACLDAATRAIREAAAAGRVALVDREKVNGARRSLFGFNLHGVPLFGEGSAGGEDPSEIQTTVRSASEVGTSGWLITLAEGGIWATLEPLPLPVRAGSPVTVHRTALGGYMMKVSGRGIRVERRR